LGKFDAKEQKEFAFSDVQIQGFAGIVRVNDVTEHHLPREQD
jgi:hypothetical protein